MAFLVKLTRLAALLIYYYCYRVIRTFLALNGMKRACESRLNYEI